MPIARTPDKAERDGFYTRIAWRRCRAAFLGEHPLCRECEDHGELTAATIAHHALERLARPDLAFDHGNLVGLCSACHTRLHKQAPRGGSNC